MDFLAKGPKQRNMDMRFGTCSIRSLYKVGSLMTVSRELSRYRLDLVGVQEVRWEGSGTAPAGEDNIKMFLFRDRIECCGLDWFRSG
jgi:hypothetical protein